MKKTNSQLGRVEPSMLVRSMLVVIGVLLLAPSVNAQSVTHLLSGEFGEDGPFGGAGVEGGSFSGSFTYDLMAVDQLPDNTTVGIYEISDWSIDIFFESGDLADNLAPEDGGVGSIYLDLNSASQNLSLEFVAPVDGAERIFGGFFDLSSLVTLGLPSDMSGATFSDGLIGFVAGTSAAVTFMDSAVITAVPVPPALLLFGSGVLGLLGFSRSKKPEHR